MKHSVKKVVAVLVLLGLLLQSTTIIFAAPSSSKVASLTVLQSTAEEKLIDLDEFSTSSTGQYGLFLRLEQILQYSIFLDFLHSNYSAFGLDRETGGTYSGVYEPYFKNLNDKLLEFHNDFSVDSEKYMFLDLAGYREIFKYPYTCKYIQNSLAKDSESYIQKYLDTILAEGLEEVDVKKKYGSELAVLYGLLDDVIDDASIVKTWSENNASSGSNLKASVAKDLYEKFSAILKDDKYQDLLNIGNVLKSTIGEMDVAVDTSLSYIENMADVQFNSDDELEVDVEPALKLAYLAAFSCSSVYTPFVSYTGNTEFMKALESLAEDDAIADVKLLYNSTKTLKKPLYKRELDSSGNPTGIATIITLEDFITDIEAGNIGSLCTVLGVFDKGSSSWVYKQRTDYEMNENGLLVYPYSGQTSQLIMEETSSGDTSVNSSTSNTSDDSEVSQGENSQIESNINQTQKDNERHDLQDSAETNNSSTDGWFTNITNQLNSPSTTNTVENGNDSGNNTEKTSSVGDTIYTKLFDSKYGVLRNMVASADIRSGFGNVDEETEIGTSGGADVYAYDSITDESAMSAPVLLYGAKYSRATDNMTTMLMTNILESVDNLGAIDQSSYLYLNPYGDIVLDDDLVILPGCANPLCYANDEYNPFTVAFMNSYPSVLKNTSYFKLASKADIGKYVIFCNYDPALGSVVSWMTTKTTSKNTITSNAPLTTPAIVKEFTSNNGADDVTVFKTRRLIFGADDDWTKDNPFYCYTPLLNSATITVNGNNIFPYASSEDLTGIVAQAIAQNMFTYFAVNSTTNELSNQGNLHDAYILDAFIINCLNGTDNATGYENDVALEYEQYSNNASSRKYKMLKSLSENLLDRISNVSGVIGIKSVYSNPITATILNFIQQDWLIFVLIVVIIVLFYFSKAKLDMLQSFTFLVVYLVLAYLYVSIFPSMIPATFNILTNNMAQNASYEILSLDAEHYSYDDTSSTLDDDGYLNYASTSIDLYRVSGAQRKTLLNNLNVVGKDIVGGNIVLLNEESGVYIKGDAICVNTNSLFDTLKIDGKLSPNYAYTLEATKTVSNNVDYYIPFYDFVDLLIEKVNGVAETYSIPRRTSTYANGKVKNNYLLYSYVNSKPFVTPGEYDYVIPRSELDWLDEEIKAYEIEGANVRDQLEEIYGNNADWLGVSELFYNLTDAHKKTLWAQTMMDLGYYSQDWVPNTEKIDELITYINYQTRKFVLDMSDQIGCLSDDVMLKIISLRAVIAFTQHVSDLGHWMYPYTINYDEMTIASVVQSVLIEDYTKYINLDMDVIDYVFEEHGWFNLIVFDVMIVLLSLVAALINNVVALAYLAFGVVLVIRMVTGKGIREPLKGGLKVILIIIGCSTLQTITILVARSMNGSAFAIYFIIAICTFNLYVLLNMTLSVVRNITEFGNTAMSVKLDGLVHGFRGLSNKVSTHNFRASNLTYNRSAKTSPRYNYYDEDSRYRLDSSVDDVYNHSNQHEQYDDSYDDHTEDAIETVETFDTIEKSEDDIETIDTF